MSQHEYQKLRQPPLTRRCFLKFGAGTLGAALLAACKVSPKPVPTQPMATATPAPIAAPTATTAPATEPTKATGKMIVRYLMWDQVTPEEDALLKRFEVANADIDVEYVVGSPDKVAAMIAANDAPDLWWANTLGRLGKEGHLLNLQPFIDNDPEMQELVKDYIPSLLQTYRAANGDIYGLPKDANAWFIIYNKELFEKAGAPLPQKGWTWQDMVNAALTIKELGGEVNGLMAGFWKGWWDCDYTTFIFQNGGKCMSDDGLLGFDSPEAMGAFEWIHDTFHVKKAGITGGYASSLSDWNIQIQQGQLAMAYDLVGGLSRFETDDQDNAFRQMVLDGKLGAAAVPKGVVEGNTLYNGGFVGWANSKYPEGTYRVLKWVCGPEGIQDLLTWTASLPANKSIDWPEFNLAKEGFDTIEPEIRWIWENVQTGLLPFDRNDPRWDDTEVGELLTEGLDKVLNLGELPKDVIPNLVADVNARMEELGQPGLQ